MPALGDQSPGRGPHPRLTGAAASDPGRNRTPRLQHHNDRAPMHDQRKQLQQRVMRRLIHAEHQAYFGQDPTGASDQHQAPGPARDEPRRSVRHVEQAQPAAIGRGDHGHQRQRQAAGPIGQHGDTHGGIGRVRRGGSCRGAGHDQPFAHQQPCHSDKYRNRQEVEHQARQDERCPPERTKGPVQATAAKAGQRGLRGVVTLRRRGRRPGAGAGSDAAQRTYGHSLHKPGHGHDHQ